MVNLGRALLLFLIVTAAGAQKLYVYVGDIGAESAGIAWGTADGVRQNTIGRDSISHGKAEVRVGDHVETTTKSWVVVNGLTPDTDYSYTVSVNGMRAGEGHIRTWPATASQLSFFVIGDYGSGMRSQYRVADAMWTTFLEREKAGRPVRFVLTTGDNIYDEGVFGTSSGSLDIHWRRKFFQPYEALIRRVPFYPTLGNHDGNESESRADLAVYLDNFFFPGMKAARHYSFSFGGLAEFFALDTTLNTTNGPPLPAYGPDSAQFRWLKEALPRSRAQWKIPYFHHPAYGGGPRHEPSLGALNHLVKVFEDSGVKVAFSGHEHNFQFSNAEKTKGIRFVVTGAGGELRTGDIRRDMDRANIQGWSPQHHFLLVDIEGTEMSITPLSYTPVVVRDKNGSAIQMPLRVRLK